MRFFVRAKKCTVLLRTTKYYEVLLRTTKVLLRTIKHCSVLQSTTRYYSSTVPCYSVLKSTTKYYTHTKRFCSSTLCTYKVLLYSSTTLYYKVLYTPVLLCTTVLLRTTKYYSGNTLHSKVLQCTTSVLQSITPYYKKLLHYYSELQSHTHESSSLHRKRHLECAEQQKSSSNITKYCACHEKMTLMIDRCHT